MTTHPSIRLLAVLASLTPCAFAQGGNFGLIQTVPAQNAIGVDTAAVLGASFTEPVDPASLDADTFLVFGRWSGAVPGSTVVASSNTITFTPSRPFFPGEAVHVRLDDGVASIHGGTLAAPSSWSFWAGSRAGDGLFTLEEVIELRLPGETFLQSYGVYAGDLDGDGAPDFSVPSENTNDVRVLMNDGCGAFATPVSYAVAPFSRPSSNEGTDLDGDGNLDLVTANFLSDQISVLFGDGTGAYQPSVDYAAGDQTRGVTIVDLDGDGDPDVVSANRGSSELGLHVNQGDGTLAAVTFLEAGGDGETSMAVADADQDGVMDLYVGLFFSEAVGVVLGDGAGSFAPSTTAAIGGRPWTIGAGDLDGDGDCDVVAANANTATAGLALGDGAGGLTPLPPLVAGDFPLSVDLGDLDADGDLDLVVSNFTSANVLVYTNDGSASFSAPAVLPTSSAGSCSTLVDYDRDGDLDILALDELDDRIFVYRQTETVSPTVQPAVCGATLRLNELTGPAGFDGRSPRAVPVGGRVFLGLTGPPNAAYITAIGLQTEPGTPAFGGLLHLTPVIVLAVGALDASGEALVTIAMPVHLPAGLEITNQAFVLDPTPGVLGHFTNPEELVLVP